MKIAFYADHPYWGQLGNNGGTRTILKSADVLRDLGHDVSVVAHKDKFTWFKHQKPVHEIPFGTEVIIAVSVAEMKSLVKTYKGTARLAYWARPFENWQMSMDKIAKYMHKINNRGGIIMCNSSWQVKQLNELGIDCRLQFAGLDYNWERSNSQVLNRIGCQYSTKARKQWNEFARLHDELGDAFEYVAFGVEGSDVKFLSTCLKSPDHDSLEKLYQSCAFFFCPNSLEGFYNCGYEAALCGCLIVASDWKQNGMTDYVSTDTAHVFANIPDAATQIKTPNFSKIDKMYEKLKLIGDRKTNMKRMVEALNEKG